MIDVAVKAGVGFAVVLGIFGVAQSQVVIDSLLLFTTVGLIPGTSIEIPPDLTLIMVAAAFMAITVLLFREYSIYRATLDAVLPEYTPNTTYDDTRSEHRIPRLRRVVLAGRSILYVANDLSMELYFWLRSLGYPIVVQAIAVHEELNSTFVRIDRMAANINIHESLETASHKLNNWTREGAKAFNAWSDKALKYYIRMRLR